MNRSKHIQKRKNTNLDHTSFELNYGYHLKASYKKDVDPYSKSKSADEMVTELWELIVVCKNNLIYAQKRQKRFYDKYAKPRNWGVSEKVWLNSKYIKTKQKKKLESKFFDLFKILQPIGKQAYNLELLKEWKLHNVFHMSLLKQNTTR